MALTGLPAINRDLGRRFLPEFLKAMTIGTIAVALLIFSVFRTIRHTLLAMLPTALRIHMERRSAGAASGRAAICFRSSPR